MANPDQITILKGAVTKIATAVTAGAIRNLSRDTVFFFTTRTTGADAPTAAAMAEEMSLMFADDGINETISSSAAIDIYVMAPNDNGSLRADLP